MIPKKAPVMFVHQQKHVGGGQSYVNGLSGAFVKKGHPIEVVENETSLKLISRILKSNSKYIIWSVYDRFPIFPIIFSYLSGKKNLLVIYGIWKLESASLFVDYKNRESVKLQKRRELKLLLRQSVFLLFSSGIIHLSRYSKKLFFSVKPFRLFNFKKQCLIYGGADSLVFRSADARQKSSIRKSLGIGKEDLILIMAGRVEKRKNYSDGLKVLREIKRLLNKKNAFLYLIISSGEFNDYRFMKILFNEINNLEVGENVRVVSGISGSKLAKFYQAADCYLMLSKELETFGLVTLESINSGLPVFGYNACATPEIIRVNNKLWLSKAGNIAGVSKLILNFIRKSKPEKEHLLSDLKLNASEFTWENAAERIISSFN